MWTDGIILLGALICAILPVLAAGQVAADGKVQEASASKRNSSDIWKDLPEVPSKWGEQYDLNLEQRDACGVQKEFVPIITMPEELVGDLFAKQGQLMEEHPFGLLEKGRGFLKDFFSKATTRIKEKLDEATNKVKNAVNDFQKKKSEAVKNVKAKLDEKTNEIETHLKEVSDKLDCEKASAKCLEDAKESFEEYQASLQQSMDPCLNEMKDAIKSHESRIDAARNEVNDILAQLKSCSEGDSIVGGIKERLSAAFGSVKCTARMLANLMKNQLGSRLKNLTNAVKRAGTLKKVVGDANKCIEEPPKDDLVQKQQAKLVEKTGPM